MRKIPLLFGLVFLAVACSSSTSPAIGMPLATGASLQAYLDVQDYRETWALYPGKGKLYEPEIPSPHGALLTTYVNEAALQATESKQGVLAEGSIIVKENYMLDGTYAGATVMYKVQGYDPSNNDWFWAKWGARATIEEEGKVQDCITCHGSKRENDFIWTADLQQ